MKKYTLLFKIFISTICLFALQAYTMEDSGSAFFAAVKKSGMNFTKPLNTIETNIIMNDELNYQYALKDTVNKIEIRYLIYPLQELVKQYNGPHSDTGISAIDPNFLQTNLLLAYSLKVQGKDMNSLGDVLSNIKELSHATADLEFNADWGAEVNVEPCDEFAQQYKYCTLFEIHKDNMADAFVIYLYNDKNTFKESVKPDFHSLVFKK